MAREAPFGDSSRVISKNVALQGFSKSGLRFFAVHVAECQASAGEPGGCLGGASHCRGKGNLFVSEQRKGQEINS